MVGSQIGEWNKNIAAARKAHFFGHDADDLARNTIDIQSLAQSEGQRAKTIAPESLAD